MNIDEIYEDPEMIKKAIESLSWENATIASVHVGYEDHGLLTVQVIFQGESWSQGFHSRNLGGPGDAFKNFVQGWLKIAPVAGAKGKPVRIGRTGTAHHEDLVAVRPIIESAPIFWPGGDEDRFYAFDSQGNTMERGR